MDLTERQLSRETIYEGKILHIYRDDVLLPNGRTSVREVADHPGGVAIVALDENDNVLTVKQYRYVFSRVLEEIPAGKLERGEDPDEAALRELREETGATPKRMTNLGKLLVSPRLLQRSAAPLSCRGAELRRAKSRRGRIFRALPHAVFRHARARDARRD